MSITILEALESAEMNLKNSKLHGIALAFQLAEDQIHNARILLEKGYTPYAAIEPLLEKYGAVENVPEVEDEE